MQLFNMNLFILFGRAQIYLTYEEILYCRLDFCGCGSGGARRLRRKTEL